MLLRRLEWATKRIWGIEVTECERLTPRLLTEISRPRAIASRIPICVPISDEAAARNYWNTPSIVAVDEWAATEVRPWEEIYILAGIHDANGSPTRGGFDTFFDDRGYAKDVVGFALSYGRSAADGLRDQYAGELYYRMQLTRRLALTPSVQLIANPSANRDQDLLALFGIRARLDL